MGRKGMRIEGGIEVDFVDVAWTAPLQQSGLGV
jgi:hypothetical protein